MEYTINVHYPISELSNIGKWWQTHREYDINEIREPREYEIRPITEIDSETGEERTTGEEKVLVERAYDDYVEIVKRSDEQIINDLRNQREYECFTYINRGAPWYGTLTEEQKAEFQEWYIAWLNVTETLEVPQKPEWLK